MQATYVYDVFGQRIEKDVDPDASGSQGAVTSRFAYDPQGNAWADLDTSNNLTMRRLYDQQVDALFARIGSDGIAAWYLEDMLGSIRNLIDASGNLIDTIAYDAFGNVWWKQFTDRLKEARTVRLVRKKQGASSAKVELSDPLEISQLVKTMDDGFIAGREASKNHGTEFMVQFDTKEGVTELRYEGPQIWREKWPGNDPKFDKVIRFNSDAFYKKVIELLDKAGKQTPETKPP